MEQVKRDDFLTNLLIFTHKTKCLESGILMSFLQQKFHKGPKKIRFADKEIKKETGLSSYEIRKAKKHLKKSGCFHITKEGCPTKTTYVQNKIAINQARKSFEQRKD